MTDQRRKLLEETKLDLLKRFNRDGIQIENHADQLDNAVDKAERERAARGLNEAKKHIADIDIALAWNSEDCMDCGEPIKPIRLAYVPFAVRCISCQEQKERG